MNKILTLFIIFVGLQSQAVSIESIKLNNDGRQIVEKVLEALKEAQEEQKNNSGMMQKLKGLKEQYQKAKELEKTNPQQAKMMLEQLKNAMGDSKQEEINLNPEDLDPAKEKFLMAIGLEPNYLLYRFNLASVLQLQGKLQEAKKEYDLLLKSVRGDFKFSVLFNRAILSSQLKNKDEALNFYQQALEIKPKSKEVKTNIELLMQESQSQQKGDGDNNEQDQQDQNGQNDKDGKNKNKDKKYEDGREKQKLKKPKSLSEKEIQKILNELRNQEQKIRAKDMKDNFKEPPRDKDW